jgi:hypothetical protein
MERGSPTAAAAQKSFDRGTRRGILLQRIEEQEDDRARELAIISAAEEEARRGVRTPVRIASV